MGKPRPRFDPAEPTAKTRRDFSIIPVASPGVNPWTLDNDTEMPWI
jgi:hypothetical protein